MSDTEWAEWAATHCRLHGLKAMGEDGELVNLWREILIGYRFDDLKAASLWIAAHASSAWRTKHLQLLRDHVSQLVARRAAALRSLEDGTEESQRLGRCCVCNGRGLIDVPLLANVVDGEWMPGPGGRSFPTEIVFCACSRGDWKFRNLCDQLSEKKQQWRPVTILTYELKNPDWKDQIDRREATRAIERREGMLARKLDHDRPLAKLIGGTLKRKPGG